MTSPPIGDSGYGVSEGFQPSLKGRTGGRTVNLPDIAKQPREIATQQCLTDWIGQSATGHGH